MAVGTCEESAAFGDEEHSHRDQAETIEYDCDIGKTQVNSTDDLRGAFHVSKEQGTQQSMQDIQKIFEQMIIEQKYFLQMAARSLKLNIQEDIPMLAEKLWQHPEDAWSHAKAAADARLDRSLGREFLNCLLPWGTSLVQVSGKTELITNVKFAWRRTGSSEEVQWFTKPNLETAFDIFKEWLTAPELYSLPWDDCFLTPAGRDKAALYGNKEQWPKSWRPNGYGGALGNEREITYSTSGRTFGEVLDYRTQIFDASQAMKDLDLGRKGESSVCGVISRVSIDRTHGIIDLDTIAAILCLGQGPRYWPYGGPQFLHAHIAEWSSKPSHVVRRTRIFQSATCEMSSNFLNPGSHTYDVYMYHMQSFTVVNQSKGRSMTGRSSPMGLKCNREWISFQGFYGQGILKLAERRYSTTLSMLPILKPMGHYVLLSVVDTDQRTKDEDRDVWNGSPASYSPMTVRTSPWRKYDLYPAGLYTGLAVFQLQICAFIDSWEADWNDTIDNIDRMVSVKLHTLRDVHRLRTLVIDSNANKSALYFQVLQILRFFSDSVRATVGQLEDMWQISIKPSSRDHWFAKSYLHMNDTQKILEHNWCIVRSRQRQVSEKILTRLERTTNEVKSLRDGLFSAQSVLEAQKTRILSKYLLVFTIVTIFFLPPTFVATFFGTDIFNSSSDDTTKIRFWAVMGGVSGLTYLIAALGLFGTSVGSEDRNRWLANMRQFFATLNRYSTGES